MVFWAVVTTSSDRLPKVSGAAAVSLAAMQVDLTTHLGAVGRATSTGWPGLDELLGGGLRSGTLMAVSGAAGSGRTSVALALAYLAARRRAGVIVAGAAIDPTEIVARLAARALHREHPDAPTSYGEIWSGQAWTDDASRRHIADAIDTVMKKVGSHLHLLRGSGLATTQALADCVAQQWARSDRVVLVVDDVEGFVVAADPGGARAGLSSALDGRITQIGYELRRLAEQGVCVIATVLEPHLRWLSPAATLNLELDSRHPLPTTPDDRLQKLGARTLALKVTKNRLGRTGEVPLSFVPGAATLEEAPAARRD